MTTPNFIWLADQPVRHAAGFTTLRGTPTRREDEGVNRWILARGILLAPEGLANAELRVLVDGRYRLWLNGRPIARGPVRFNPAYPRYDAIDVSDALLPGANVVAVLVHVPGIDLAWYETVRGHWQPVFGDGALHVSAFGRTAEGEWSATADERWRMIESGAWRRDAPRAGWGQDFIEDFDARRLDPAWTAPDFDDSAWPHARVMIARPDGSEAARGWGEVRPFPAMQRSELPQQAEAVHVPAQVEWVRPVRPQPDLPVNRRLYEEQLEAADPALVSDAPAMLRDDESTARVRTRPGRDTAILVRFDPYHAGRPFIEIDAEGGEIVEVAFAEALPGEHGRGTAGDGLRSEGHLGCAHVFRYTARAGRQRFERFNWTAVRAMQIVVRNAPGGMDIVRLGSAGTGYAADEAGAFSCSDPLLDRLWHVGRYTVRQCMHDAWVDCPGREARQWVGDGVVQFDVAAASIGPSAYPLHRQFLIQAGESQRGDGLVRMFAPGDNTAEALTIPDNSLLWLLSAERYLQESGDEATIETLMPGLERVMQWCARHRGPSGLIAHVPHWHFIEWANIGRSGEAFAFNALQVGALRALARMAQTAERPRLAARCAEMADAAAEALAARHWNEARGVYVDSVDPDSAVQDARVSQHANALALLFDIGPRARWPGIVDAITDSARLKLTAAPPIVPEGEPFDPDVDIVRANSFFQHFVHAGLARAGCWAWVLDDLRRSFAPMLETGTTTLWESFHPGASLCHGFSATGTAQLSRRALGVTPIAPGYRTFAVAPDVAGLTSASGIIPTAHGPITVAWQRADGRVVVDVSHPETCTPRFSVPTGFTLTEKVDRPGKFRAILGTVI
ncbi:alpha-L-rhamnosidase C-terminal domain-containing protein [Sphingosinicella microcystinivorans]|uniref:alpha-L-rhamnosidase-related protein n=1 Tax=Sphingosinicella microcystinivorans TaxID=335406 RepID=UPI0022F3CD13|nr:alpha-L-rhamnosidase C-terminal domain-containing protein [Sphingosinicella microcystinivorans]WBX86258.1 alpha-L-rhamnosidase C-terminal domain-containing protein [Sphingosinicella microcystinivorans]